MKFVTLAGAFLAGILLSSPAFAQVSAMKSDSVKSYEYDSKFGVSPMSVAGTECNGLYCDHPGSPDSNPFSPTTPGFGPTDWLDRQNDQFNSDPFHPGNPMERICLAHCWDHANAAYNNCLIANTQNGLAVALEASNTREICLAYKAEVFNKCVERDRCY